jgi:hypothetical protein
MLVLDGNGKVVEKGEGIKGKGDWWEYAPTAEGRECGEGGDKPLTTKVTKEHEGFLLDYPRKPTIAPLQRLSARIMDLRAWQNQP